MEINIDKSIGNVIFIVEGEKTEFHLLWRIFVHVLGYQMEAHKRGNKYKKYNEDKNTTSRVFVINSLESNIKFIDNDEGYIDDIFQTLRYEYELDVENAAIYYLFDRDHLSNTDVDLFRKLVVRLTNSRENKGYDEGGLLLISYPCVEAFIHNAKIDLVEELNFGEAKDLRQYLHDLHLDSRSIESENLITATKYMIKELLKHGEFDVDDLVGILIGVFDSQEKLYLDKDVYLVLSNLAIALIDLGIISSCQK